MTLTIGKRKTSQQFRLLHRDRISDGDLAATHHLSIDAAVGMAQTALQRLRDGEVACGGLGVDIDGGAAGDPFYDLQPGITDRQRLAEQFQFVPGRPALDIEVGPCSRSPGGCRD